MSANDVNQTEASTEPEVVLPVECDWLVKIINDKCPGAEGKLDGYTCEIIGKGKGFVSVCTSVKFNWNPDSKGVDLLPKAVVIKKPTPEIMKQMDEKMGNMFGALLIDLHNQECNTYSYFNLYPPVPVPLAKLFYAEKATESSFGLLILEDLTDIGVSTAFGEDMTIEQIRALAEQIASVQAYSLNNPNFQGYFSPVKQNPFKEMLENFDASLEKVETEVSREKLRFSVAQLKAIQKAAEKDIKLFEEPTQFGYTAIVALGDVQPNNILWRRNPDGTPSNEVAALLDFQIAHLGSCMLDLSNLMTMSIPKAMRRECQDAITDHYLDTLRSKLRPGLECPITRDEVMRARSATMAQYGVLGLGNVPMMKNFVKVAGLKEGFYESVVDRIVGIIDDFGEQFLKQTTT